MLRHSWNGVNLKTVTQKAESDQTNSMNRNAISEVSDDVKKLNNGWCSWCGDFLVTMKWRSYRN